MQINVLKCNWKRLPVGWTEKSSKYFQRFGFAFSGIYLLGLEVKWQLRTELLEFVHVLCRLGKPRDRVCTRPLGMGSVASQCGQHSTWSNLLSVRGARWNPFERSCTLSVAPHLSYCVGSPAIARCVPPLVSLTVALRLLCHSPPLYDEF